MADSKLEIKLTLRDEASRKLQTVSQRLNNVGRSAQTAGMDLMKFSAPFVGLGFLSVKAAADFESSFAGVRKTVNATEEQFQDLSDSFRQMSKEIPTSVNELNSIAEAAGQLGIEIENIKDFTRTIADIAVTTNLTADAAASGFARIANITGLAQTDFDKLGSALVDLGNNLATTEAEILQFTIRIAGAGEVAGLTQAEIMGIAGAFASVGVPAERGGTAVQTALIKMHQAATTGGEVLDTFARVTNQTGTQFAKMFKEDAAGAFTAFVEGLAKQGDEVFTVFEELELTDKRLMGGFLALANAGDLLRDSMALGNRAFEENTALAKEAEQRYGTFASQMLVLKNTFQDAAIELGQVLIPQIQEYSETTLIPAIERVAEFVRRHGELLEKVVVCGLAIGVLGAAMVAFGIIVGALTKAFVLLRGAVMGGIFVIGAMTALFGGPWTAAIIAAVAVITFLSLRFKDSMKEMQSDYSKLMESIGQGTRDTVNWMIRGINMLIRAMNALREMSPMYSGTVLKEIPQLGPAPKGPGMFSIPGLDMNFEGIKTGLEEWMRDLTKGMSEWAFGKPEEIDWDQVASDSAEFGDVLDQMQKAAAEAQKIASGIGAAAAGEGGTGGAGGVASLLDQLSRVTTVKREWMDFRPVLKALGKTMEDDVSPMVQALMKQFPDMDSVQAFEVVMAGLEKELKESLAAQLAEWTEFYENLTMTEEEKAAASKALLAAQAKEAAEHAEKMKQHAAAVSAAVATMFGDPTGALGMTSKLAGPNAMGELMSRLKGVDPIKDAALHSQIVRDWGIETNRDIAAAKAAVAPPMAQGGFVGGAEGAPSLAMVHGGELVLNRRQQQAMGSTINITVNGGGDEPQRLARLIADEVNLVLGQNALRDEQVRSR